MDSRPSCSGMVGCLLLQTATPVRARLPSSHALSAANLALERSEAVAANVSPPHALSRTGGALYPPYGRDSVPAPRITHLSSPALNRHTASRENPAA